MSTFVANDPDENFPGPWLLGEAVTQRDLSDVEWDAACQGAGIALSYEAREVIGRALWWSAWETANRDKLPRMSVIKKRLKSFVHGVDIALEAIGYLDAHQLENSTSHPPIGSWGTSGGHKATWMALVQVATTPGWRGSHWTKRAIDPLKSADDALTALHALAYTAAKAIKYWEGDKGGKIAGGDRRFIYSLISILRENNIDTSYRHDRSLSSSVNDGINTESMSGSAWDLLIQIWSIRPEAFAAEEKSTLGKYYRDMYARLRNEPPA
ncbi:MAG: hypothetical protein LCH78_20555 [Proteobacteria bacterium]|nr:hypothetical protein [Pseudomonadota bacterium]